MAKSSPIITNFTAGEVSPLLAGRVDLKYYNNACRKLRNFITTIQGPARRCPGTHFAAEVKTSANRTWLARFEFNIEQAYVLEFGNLYIRFFSNHGVVGAPFEVTTPYATADLTNADGTFALRFVQSGDALCIVHRKYQQRLLLRTGAATFTISKLDAEGGPFKDLDPDNLITVYSATNTGSGVTLTASSAIFLSTHVGALFLLEQKDIDSVKQWEPAKVIVANDVRRSDGKNYHAINAATTGTIRPIHSRGAKFDGDAGIQWQFDDQGYGWCKITAIGGGGTTATVDIISRIPDNAVGVANASKRWAFGAWSDQEEWPDGVTFFKERLAFTRNQEGWASVNSDFVNFRDRDDGGVVTKDMALSFTIASDRGNRIEWLAPSDVALLVGTAGDEHAISTITSEAFGPGNIEVRKQTEHGSRHVPVARIGDGVIFVQKSGRKIRDMRPLDTVSERWAALDMTVLAEHVTYGGVIDAAYQQEPDSVLWSIKYTGQLLGFTINREQDVRAWHPHRIGGYIDAAKTQFAVVESIITIPSPDSSSDELWMIVRRYINGVMVRYIEWMHKHHNEGDDVQDAFYVNSGLTLDNVINATLTPGAGATVKGTTGVIFTAGSAVFAAGDVGRFIHYRYSTVGVTGKVTWFTSVALITGYTDTTHVTGTILWPWVNLTLIAANGWRMTVILISGLTHLKGETVDVWADGAAYPQLIVNGSGQVTLPEPASKAQIGLPCPAILQPMPLEAGAQDGTAQGKTGRISRAIIRFHETIGARYGRDEDQQLDRVEFRDAEVPMDTAPNPFSGDVLVSWPDGYDDKRLITVVQDQPGPCTVVAIMPQLHTQDAR